MKPNRRHIALFIAVALLCTAASTLGQAPAETPPPATPADSAPTPQTPRVYFLDSDTLDEETSSTKERLIDDERLNESYLRATEEAAQALEESKLLETLKGLEELEALKALDVPGIEVAPLEEFILPDTVYITEVTIGPEGIEYYDQEGKRHVIIGKPVPPDEPFVFREDVQRRMAEIVQIGVSVTVDRDELVEGNVVVVGGNATILGQVKGDVIAILGDVIVEGYVHGSVAAPTGKVKLGPNGEVRRDVVGSEIIEKPGSRIGGTREYSGVRLPAGIDILGGLLITLAVLQIALAIFTIFLVMLSHAFAAKNIAIVKSRISDSGIKAFIIGIITQFLGIPILFVLLIITVIGIPVAFLVLPIAIVVGTILGFSGFGLLLGDKLSANTGLNIKSQLGKTVAGSTVLLALIVAGGFLVIIPWPPIRFIGWVLFGIGHAIGFIAMTTGLGAVVMTRFGNRPRKTAAKPGPAAAPTPPSPAGESSPVTA